MYRKSILTIKSISSTLSQVSPSPNSSPSAQNDLLIHLKTSPFINLCPWRRSFSVAAAYAAQRSDFSLDSDPNGSNQKNPYGSDRRSPSGFYGEGAVGSYHSNAFGIDRGSSASLQQNLNGFNGGTSDMHQRWDLGGFRQSNSSDGHQREAQQWSSNGFCRENPNGPVQNSVAEFRRGGSRIGGQFNQMNNGQNLGTNGFYRESYQNSDADGYQIGNSFEAPRQSQTRVLSFGSEEGDDYPYENQVGFFRETRGEVHQDPAEDRGVNPGKHYQNYNSHRRGNFMPNAHHNLMDMKSNCESSARKSTVIGETSTLDKSGALSGGNRRKVYQEPIGSYSVSQGQFGPNAYGSLRENPLPYGPQDLRDMKSNDESSIRESTEIRETSTLQKSGGLYGGNHREVYQEPSGYYSVHHGQLGPNSYGSHRENPLPYEQQNIRGLKSNYESSTHESTEISKTSILQKSDGLYGGNHRCGEVYKDPSDYYNVYLGQLGSNAYGSHRKNPLPYGQQNLRDMKSNYELSTHESTEIGETINSQKSDGFYGGNRGEVYQDPSGYYGVNQWQLGPNAYGSHRENPLPCGQQNLSESPAVNIGEFNSELSIGGSVAMGEIITYEGLLNKLEGFCKEGKLKEAFAFLSVFEKVCMPVDLPRYLMLVQACGDAKSLKKARVVHDHLSRTFGELGVQIHNKILDVYSKCGSMADAYQLFERMPWRNLTSWETMIRGHSDNGLGEEAIELFTEFKKMGLKPDGGLFNAIFYTCGVLEAVDQGMLYFQSMKVDFGISPVMEHYISIVDMFGRSGYLNEALEFIEMMPIEPTIDVWETLMKFCIVNGYIELGDRCAEIVEQLDPSRVKQSEMALMPIKASETMKEVEGKTPLDIKHQVREFTAGDRSHPENDIIYYHTRCLAQQMKEAGYVPNTTCTLHDVDIENKEEALLYHSERLATVHGLMTSRARMPLRIIKNLRVCRDCHNALKIISKLVGRLIVARDNKRFHHFENGVCSCNDYW